MTAIRRKLSEIRGQLHARGLRVRPRRGATTGRRHGGRAILLAAVLVISMIGMGFAPAAVAQQGPPDHAGNGNDNGGGPPDHAGNGNDNGGGPPDHAGNGNDNGGGPPDHAGDPGPPDHAGVPTENVNVHTNGPPGQASGTGPPDHAAAWNASATHAQESLEVDIEIGDELVVTVTDEQVSDGREVALDADAVEEALDRRPSVVLGTHDSGDEWSSEVEYQDGQAIFEVPHFSSNTVEFAGSISIDGNNAVDGTEWQYEISDLDAVDNFEVELTGHTETSAETHAVTAESTTTSVDVGGTTAPENAEVTLTGVREETPQSATALSDGDSITIDGNNDPENETVTIEGSGSTSAESQSGTLSDGASDSVSVDGIVDPTGETLTITGPSPRSESLSSISGSGGSATESLVVDGNVDAEGSISFSNPQSATGSEITDYNVELDPGQSQEITLDASDFGQIDSVEIGMRSGISDYPQTVDVYVDGTSMGAHEFTSEERVVFNANSADTSGETATLTISSRSSNSAESDVRGAYGNVGESRIDADYSTGSPSSVTVNGQTISSTGSGSLSLDTETTNEIAISTDGGPVDYSITGTEYFGVTDASVSVDGSTVSEPDVLDGSVTESISLSRGSHTVSADYHAPGGDTLDYTLEWTEDDRVRDPSVSVDGSTVSHDGPLASGETSTGSVMLSTGAHTVSISSTGPVGGVSVDWTEIQQTENPSVEINTDTIAHAGELADGATTSQAIDLPLGSSTAAIDSDGPVAVDIDYTEISESTNPTIHVNEAEAQHSGVLADGQTTALDVDPGWIKEGTNNVSVELADAGSGPEPQVDMNYAHDAASAERSMEVDATAWRAHANVSNTFVSAQQNADMTMRFAATTTNLENLEVRYNGGTWSEPVPDDYALNDSKLTLDLGDVAADTTVDVRTTARKMKVHNGEIEVLNPTVAGDSLDTTFAVQEVSGGPLEIDVTNTDPANPDRLHYADTTSWDDNAVARVSSSSQEIRFPDANEGGEASVTTLPLGINPERGTAEVDVQRTSMEDEKIMQFHMESGSPSSEIEVVYHDTVQGQEYALYSEDLGYNIDTDVPSSPVSLYTDGSSQTYTLLEHEESAPLVGPGGQEGGGLLGSVPILGSLSIPGSLWAVILLIGGIGGLGLVARSLGGRSGRSSETADDGGSVLRSPLVIVGIVALTALVFELVTVRSLAGNLIHSLVTSGIVPIITGIAILVGLWLLDSRTRVDIPLWLLAGVGLIIGIWTLETLAPGAIIDSLAAGLEEVSAFVWLGLVGGGGYLAYRYIQARGEPDTQVEFTLEDN